MIVAGIDEAGYGPLLGPMVVSAAVFRVPGPPGDLWESLSPAVARSSRSRSIPVNDSKKLFQQGKGLARLEEGVLPFVLHRRGRVPRHLRELLDAVARRGRGSPRAYLDAYPWYRGRDVRLPCDTFRGVLRRLAGRLAERLEGSSTEFLGLAAIPLEVREFNAELTGCDNKSRVSFGAVSRFLRRLWKQYPDEPVEVLVDRQGGRIRYGRLLFEALRPRSIRIDGQTPECSSYVLARGGRAGRGAGSFRVTFTTDCEDKHLPVALASMLSKYVRELHMTLFNQFWTENQRGLKPTAGYFTDARRFLRDTQVLRCRLGIDESLLVRRR